jgi:hypothetical protein
MMTHERILVYVSRMDIGFCLIRSLSQKVNIVLGAVCSGKVSSSLGTLGLVRQERSKCSLHYVSQREIFAESFRRQT